MGLIWTYTCRGVLVQGPDPSGPGYTEKPSLLCHCRRDFSRRSGVRRDFATDDAVDGRTVRTVDLVRFSFGVRRQADGRRRMPVSYTAVDVAGRWSAIRQKVGSKPRHASLRGEFTARSAAGSATSCQLENPVQRLKNVEAKLRADHWKLTQWIVLRGHKYNIWKSPPVYITEGLPNATNEVQLVPIRLA